MAACLVFFAACGNGGSKEKVVAPIPDNFVKFENAKFSFSYPNELKVNEWAFCLGEDDECANYCTDDGSVNLNATFMESGTSAKQLKTAAKSFLWMAEMSATNYQLIKEAEVNGNTVTYAYKDGEKIVNGFIVSGEGSHSVSGSLEYPADMASVWDAYVAPFVTSMEVK